VRTMTLFCDGRVILPEHIVFPPDLVAPDRDSTPPSTEIAQNPAEDFSLSSAVRRHVRMIYQQANQNQRRTARLLGISRATLARHLRAGDPK